MASITKQKLSGSTNGRGIKVGATSTPGTAIHTATNTASVLDELWLYLWNTHSADVLATVEIGGTTDPDDLIEKTIPAADGLYLVVPGLVLDGGVLVKAFAATTNVIVAFGFVNRIDQS